MTKFYLAISFQLLVYTMAAQLNFYSVKITGGVTGDGWSPGISNIINGTFNIHIAPGSTIHKAYLFAGEFTTADSINLLFNGTPITFVSGVTQVTPTFPNTLYGNGACVHAIDVTNLVSPNITSYTITGTSVNTVSYVFNDFYLYVVYANSALQTINSTVFLDTVEFTTQVFHYLKLPSKLPSNKDVALAFITGYMCGSGDGENISVNGTNVGYIYGPDLNNSPSNCGGPVGSFYYENGLLTGINGDNANQAVSGYDALTNIAGLYNPGSDSLYVQYNHQNGASIDNSLWAVIATYGEAVDINNFCYNDTTTFLMADSASYVAIQWDFDDPASGPLNIANNAFASHIFTSPGTYNVSLIRAFITPPFSDTTYYPVTINTYPIINLGNDTTLCLGQSITLNAGGLNNYLWSNGTTTQTLTTTVQGNYYVTGDNAGCATTDSILVSFILCGAPTANFASSDTVFCEKQCIDFFDISLNNPTSWQWTFTGGSPGTSTDQNPTNICYNNYGSFDVQLIACNSFACDTVLNSGFIVEYVSPPPPSVVVSNDTLYCNSFAISYAWYSTTNPTLVLSTNSHYAPALAGNYYVVVADSNGCEVPSATIGLNVGWQPLQPTPVHVWYNGVTGYLHVEGINEKVTITIYDMMGRQLLHNGTMNNSMVTAYAFSHGIYHGIIEYHGRYIHFPLVIE